VRAFARRKRSMTHLYCTTEELLERVVNKGGVKSLVVLLTKAQDIDAQRFAALALANCASAGMSCESSQINSSNLCSPQH
jgi:hypothetical protein